MCLILFAHRVHPDFRLVVAANRDEFHARPTAPIAEWSDVPGVFGGRDLVAGGSWLAISRSGRWAAVTNFRQLDAPERTGGPSRGALVADFMTTEESPLAYLQRLPGGGSAFGGFNLLVGDREGVYWTSNRSDPSEILPLAPGVYGISNHLIDTPWPKVVRGKRALAELLQSAGQPTPDHLLDILRDRTHAADPELPETGVPRELERALSASFIALPDYGTRSSTALLIRTSGEIVAVERSYDAAGSLVGVVRLDI